MARDVWEYFDERARTCRRLRLPDDPPATFEAEAGSDDLRGRWTARALHLSENAYLKATETIVIEDGRVHRESYAYYLIINGQEYRAWERDPSHDPAEHGHASGHERIAQGPVTFNEVVEESWDILSEEDFLADAEPVLEGEDSP